MLNPARRTSSCMSSRGFSLIELMLAMVIGMIIIGGVMSLYISTRNTQRTSQDQLQMIADARFIIDTISYDMRHASYWGDVDLTANIICRTGDAGCTGTDHLPAASGDCAAGWYADLDTPVVASDNLTNFGSTCTSDDYKNNTDVLGMHYADSNAVQDAGLATDIVFLRSNVQVGGLFKGPVIPTSGVFSDLFKWPVSASNALITKNHRLMSFVYYVSNHTKVGDNTPSLHRVELQAGPIMRDSVLIPNVVDLQFEYGVDTSTPLSDSANSYVSADNIPLDLSGNVSWARVRSVKIWVLLRSERQDRDAITGPQTFTLANNPSQTFNDGYRYYMASSVVQLRNTLQIDVAKQ